MKFDFDTQLGKGEDWERQLDRHFQKWFKIAPATMDQQRTGIDRIFTDANGRVLTVEYKSDERASSTGNAFVETVSVSTTGKQGWAYTCRADLLLYFLPGDLLIYVWKPEKLRRHLSKWECKYRTVSVPNSGYVTKGILVPLAEFEQYAEQAISI